MADEDFDPAELVERILEQQESQQRIEADYDRCLLSASNRITVELGAKGIEVIQPVAVQKALDDLITAAGYFTLLLRVAGVEDPTGNRKQVESILENVTENMLDFYDRFEVQAA